MLFAGIGLLGSCGKKTTPEEEVRNYGKYFIEKLTANQSDSLINSYPDIAKADSIMPINSDTLLVVESALGQYDVTLAEGITLKVSRTDDGKILVNESKGLFAFPADKVDIAKKTGMWDENLSDAHLNERLKDEEFFNRIKNNTMDVSKIITASKFHVTKYPEYGMDSGKGYFTLTNHSDKPIKGSDYSVSIRHIDDRFGSSTWNEKGKDIPANGSIKLSSSFHGHTVGYDFKGIKWNISKDELQKKFRSPYTGKEYQEYLDSKK